MRGTPASWQKVTVTFLIEFGLRTLGDWLGKYPAVNDGVTVVVVVVVLPVVVVTEVEIEFVTVIDLFSSSFDSASLFLGFTGRVRNTFSMLSMTSARGVVSS